MRALDECGQRRGELGPVGGQRGEQPDQRLGKAEPHAEPVEAAGEQLRRRQCDDQREDEQRNGEKGRHLSAGSAARAPTRLPGSPSGSQLTGRTPGPCGETQTMLLRRRLPQIDSRPVDPAEGFEHLSSGSITVLKWLKANQVEFVLVGPVAEAIRGGAGSPGPVAIVPAPYRRNFERLWRALDAAQARPRPDGGAKDGREIR